MKLARVSLIFLIASMTAMADGGAPPCAIGPIQMGTVVFSKVSKVSVKLDGQGSEIVEVEAPSATVFGVEKNNTVRVQFKKAKECISPDCTIGQQRLLINGDRCYDLAMIAKATKKTLVFNEVSNSFTVLSEAEFMTMPSPTNGNVSTLIPSSCTLVIQSSGASIGQSGQGSSSGSGPIEYQTVSPSDCELQ